MKKQYNMIFKKFAYSSFSQSKNTNPPLHIMPFVIVEVKAHTCMITYLTELMFEA